MEEITLADYGDKDHKDYKDYKDYKDALIGDLPSTYVSVGPIFDPDAMADRGPVTNPFADEDGLHWEFPDSADHAVHKTVKPVRVNGVEITRWVKEDGIRVSVGQRNEATSVTVTFLVHSLKTVSG